MGFSSKKDEGLTPIDLRRLIGGARSVDVRHVGGAVKDDIGPGSANKVGRQ